MEVNQHYTQLLQDLKFRISQSRHIAARLVNREQLMLYYYIGKLLNDKITEQNWGDKVLIQIANDLKKQMPNLRGFSATNLKNMRQFYTSYEQNPIGQLLTGQLQNAGMQQDIIGLSSTSKLRSTENVINQSKPTHSDDSMLSSFWGITFTHHVLLNAMSMKNGCFICVVLPQNFGRSIPLSII